MKAIVLTYDRNAILTEHMISRYEALWPQHPFEFRIPYQTTLEKPASRREYIKTVPDIKATVLQLLADLDVEEWVYWCIDDKYPLQLDHTQIEPITKWIADGAEDDIAGVLFCRARNMLNASYLTGVQICRAGETLLERKNYGQIWIHQFLRVKVLRFMFENFPDQIARAKDLDYLIARLAKPASHRLYVTAKNCAVFAESTRNGELTENCLSSLNANGMTVPEWHSGNPSKAIIIGKLEASVPPVFLHQNVSSNVLPLKKTWSTSRRIRWPIKLFVSSFNSFSRRLIFSLFRIMRDWFSQK